MTDWLVDSFLVWWLRRGRYEWSRLRRFLFERRYLGAPLPDVTSVEDVQACLRLVTWTMDGPWHLYDSISYPQRVWSKKRDDCDGFAALAAELLRRLDPAFNPFLLTAMVRPVQASHTVCVFIDRAGGLAFFDNSVLRGGCPGREDVAREITRNAKRLICWDVRRPDTFELVEFHRS